MQIAKVKTVKKNKKNHMTVSIPKSVDAEVERFLKTEIAFSMGFDSKADIVTTAIRNLLLKYGQYGYFGRKIR